MSRLISCVLTRLSQPMFPTHSCIECIKLFTSDAMFFNTVHFNWWKGLPAVETVYILSKLYQNDPWADLQNSIRGGPDIFIVFNVFCRGPSMDTSFEKQFNRGGHYQNF